MNVKIKNRTSNVPVERTISRIESFLVSVGATGISKDYEDGELKAVCFSVKKDERIIEVRLPARVEAVRETLLNNIKRPRRGTVEKINQQAARTAWKLVQDWVEVQVSMILMGQAKFLQVFLPYVWDGKKTFYDILEERQFKALPEKTQ